MCEIVVDVPAGVERDTSGPAAYTHSPSCLITELLITGTQVCPTTSFFCVKSPPLSPMSPTLLIVALLTCRVLYSLPPSRVRHVHQVYPIRVGWIGLSLSVLSLCGPGFLFGQFEAHANPIQYSKWNLIQKIGARGGDGNPEKVPGSGVHRARAGQQHPQRVRFGSVPDPRTAQGT